MGLDGVLLGDIRWGNEMTTVALTRSVSLSMLTKGPILVLLLSSCGQRNTAVSRAEQEKLHTEQIDVDPCDTQMIHG